MPALENGSLAPKKFETGGAGFGDVVVVRGGLNVGGVKAGTAG